MKPKGLEKPASRSKATLKLESSDFKPKISENLKHLKPYDPKGVHVPTDAGVPQMPQGPQP